MRPLHEEGKMPFDSAFPTRSQQPEENFSPTHKLIYQTLQKRFGEAYAQTWLEQQKGRPRGDVELRTASSLLDTPQTHLELPQNPLPNALRSRISPFEGKIKPSTPPLPVAMPLKRFSELDPTLEAEQRMSKLEAKLHPSVRLLYRVLLELALITASRRGYVQGVRCATFFCPLEIIAFSLGVDRTTIWRNLKPLKALGLVAAEDFVTTVENSPSYKSKNITAGKLWNIKLDPSDPEPARLRLEDYKAQWRDLERDIEQGRTAHNFILEAEGKEIACSEQGRGMQQSYTEEDIKRVIKLVIDWALPPSLPETPLCMTVAWNLETILDLSGTPKPNRNQMVDLAATTICKTLGDRHSLNFYRRTLWNLLRHFDQGKDWFMPFYEMILRARTDYQEGFARNAGALLHSRLKAWAVWDELQRTPPFRVGSVPLKS